MHCAISRIVTFALTFAIALGGAAAVSLGADRGIALTGMGNIPSDRWGTYHALIIGINDYQRWPQLRTAVKDATVLARELTERYGFSPDRVIVRTDKDATRRRIIGDIRTLATAMKPTDNLLVYFAGHGQLDGLTGDGYWIPVEGAAKDTSTWISNSLIKSVFSSEQVAAKNVMVIADSCYSGAMLRGGPSLLTMDGDYTAKLAKAAAKRSRQVISSGGVEPVADGGADGHSLFAYYLLKALRENDREVIDLENLFHTRVWKPVTEIGDQRPNVGRLKSPMDDDGQFVLYNQAWIEGQRHQAELQEDRQAAAARQKAEAADRMAAIQAERQRLELDRQKLEMEKELLAYKQQMDVERRQLEQQKQALEMSNQLLVQQQALEQQKRELEKQQQDQDRVPKQMTTPLEPMKTVKRATTQTLAALSPDTSGLISAPGVRSAALFPIWKTSTNPTFGSLISWPQGCVSGLLNALRVYSEYRISHTYQLFNGMDANTLLTGDILDKAATKEIWVKKSFFDNAAAPDVDAVRRYGKKIGIDVAILIRGYMGDWVEVYLVDIATGVVSSRRENAPQTFPVQNTEKAALEALRQFNAKG